MGYENLAIEITEVFYRIDIIYKIDFMIRIV